MNFPRLGIGTVGYHEEPPWAVLALLAALRNENVHVQIFLGWGAYPRYAIARGVCGRCLRYLDSWLMTPELCREFFVRGMKTADLAVVEGVYGEGQSGAGTGGLDTLCQWLRLPRIVVVDVSRVDPCRGVFLPAATDGLLLDKVEDDEHFWSLRTDLELLYGVPVLGGLADLPQLRSQFFHHLRSGCLPRSWWASIGQQFARWWMKDEIFRLAQKYDWPFPVPEGGGPLGTKSRHPVRQIALAYDEAFNRYFCETLDALEAEGAKIVDFSPLHDEGLPDNTDVVYIGCGVIGPHLSRLAANHCMKAALRRHLAAGRPLYGEGAGAAYLCQQIRLPDGQCFPMVGVLPAVAAWQAAVPEPSPVECLTRQESWLFPADFRFRGYQTFEWQFIPLRPETTLVQQEDGSPLILGCFHAVGSLVHINFAWQPGLVERFLHSHAGPKEKFDPWQTAPDAGQTPSPGRSGPG